MISFRSSNRPSSPPQHGAILPVPDVEGERAAEFVTLKPDYRHSTRLWLYITLGLTAAAVVGGIMTFLVYLYVSNTPGYMLGAAFGNLVRGDGAAGDIAYEHKQGQATKTVNGDFIAYSDPTDSSKGALIVSLAQGSARTSTVLRLTPAANYFQVIGLGNVGRLAERGGWDASQLSEDELVQLSALEGQWYTLGEDDIADLQGKVPFGPLRAGLTAQDLRTVQQLYLKHAFITAARSLGDEQINGTAALHVQLDLDRTKLANFLQALKSAQVSSLRITDQGIEALLANDSLNSVQAEAWIARGDKTFQQLRVSIPDGNNRHTMTLTFKPERVAVERQSVPQPESARSAVKLLQPLHNALTSPTSTP